MGHQDSRQSRNDYAGLGAHHVLREVPGHSRQRRPLRRLDRPALLDQCQLLLPAPPPIVVGVPLVPGAVRAAMPRTLTLGRATRPLPVPHARVGHEPAATLRTRALLLHALTIAGPSARSHLVTPAPPSGPFLASRPGSILASAEGWEIEINNKLDKSSHRLDEIDARKPAAVHALIHASRPSSTSSAAGRFCPLPASVEPPSPSRLNRSGMGW